MTEDVRHTLTQRLEERRRHTQEHWDQVRRLGTARLVAAGVFLVMAWLVTERHEIAGGWVLIPLATFIMLVLRHRDVYEAYERAQRAVTFYDDALHRIDDNWSGRGVTGERFADPLHSYSGDLDIFGKGSLFELLCLARTAEGEARLAGWLRAPAEVDVVRERQQAVAELRDAFDLREQMAVITSERSVIQHEKLAEWGERPVTLTSVPIRVIAAILGAVTFAALIYWSAGYDAKPFLVLLVIEQLFALLPREQVWDVVKGIDRPRKDLQLLSRFLRPLERQQFTSPLLVRLSATLEGAPSERLDRLIRAMEYAESYRNIFFAPFAIVLMWALQFAYTIEGWRARDGARVRVWLETLAEFEALLSLSAFAVEHPGDIVPQIVDEGPRFSGTGLGHPLLPMARMIRNDVSLGPEMQLMLISGSNMAGKSSLLRTVGTNTVLALAGATVRAQSLRVSRIHVGAAMRVQDSLQHGISHFYAEIKRLRQIVDMTEGEALKIPLLFLFDEILHGTNSYDRSIGAEAVVRTLVARGAIGLVTTHDLALTSIVHHLSPRAVNVHFQDELVDGKMTFDYTLRKGVVEKSNAIALMRAVGLDV